MSLTKYHFLHHCIGSLSDIALFLRSVQLLIKHFHPSNQHIYIHCSLLQDSPDSFDHLIPVYILFPVLNVGTRAFSVAALTLWNSLPVSFKSVGNITTFRRRLKTHLFKRAYPLFSIAPQRTNPAVYNWNCLLIMNSLTRFVLVRCRTWVYRGFYSNRNIIYYIYIYIYY